MVITSVSAFGYFLPIFAFLLVFVVIYALLIKTEILGGSQFIMLFISFILASFFIVQTKLVEFVEISSAWVAVLVIILFFLLVVLAFLPGKDSLSFLTGSSWFSWVVLGILVSLFIISSAYVFNWVFNWNLIMGWLTSDVGGMILLLVIAAIVSWKIKG